MLYYKNYYCKNKITKSTNLNYTIKIHIQVYKLQQH